MTSKVLGFFDMDIVPGTLLLETGGTAYCTHWALGDWRVCGSGWARRITQFSCARKILTFLCFEKFRKFKDVK